MRHGKNIVSLQRNLKIITTMLKNILAITGKPGLYKLVSRGNNMLIVESLVDGKRMPTYARDKIVSLADVSMFTTGDDIALNKVLESLRDKENSQVCTMNLKDASTDALRDFFAEVLPDFDRDRVYPSDIRKLIQWYNILINAGITDFSIDEEESAVVEEEKKTEKKVAQKTQVKTQKAATGKTAKTGVGAKKG